ncbi:MAG: hypothetical protein AVDCRST_MAG66-3244 [uncultured Pseudonocardia sp.]|uniref:Uncharacterized protein n=1 Tax=uncultured Pseudonocardia sp. TaxID=211455 RepID=A0A6J4Q734_9PSEU|nr:MAG: hypothetical protein AVDCRST_MAG66-3244 [uncultured Pseudonocardia sp.]
MPTSSGSSAVRARHDDDNAEPDTDRALLLDSVTCSVGNRTTR